MPPTPKAKKTEAAPTEAQLAERAEQAGYTLEKEDDGWYAEIHGTRWGPMRTVEELDEFLPNG
jgi:hypothetical protein